MSASLEGIRGLLAPLARSLGLAGTPLEAWLGPGLVVLLLGGGLALLRMLLVGRGGAAARGAGGRGELSPRQAQRAARQALRAKEYREAGVLFERAGRLDKAQEAYQHGRCYRELATLHERSGGWAGAARAWEKAGDLGRAAVAFLKGGHPQQAGDLFFRAGDARRAAEAYERAGNLESAAQSLATLEGPDLGRAGELWERQGNLREAAKCFQRLGANAELGRVLEAMGAQRPAGQAYLKAGRRADAARCLRAAGDREQATAVEVEHLITEKRYVEAAGRLRAVGDGYRAGELYLKAGDFPRAAETFEEASHLEAAAGAWIEGGEPRRAVDLLVKAGSPVRAASILEELGERAEAAALYRQGGEALRAAHLLVDMDQHADALAALEGAPTDDPDRDELLTLKARCLLETGEAIRAKALAETLLAGAPASRDNLELYSLLADALAAVRDASGMLECLYKMETVDPHYPGLSERIQDVRRTTDGSGVRRPPGPVSAESDTIGDAVLDGDSAFRSRYELGPRIGRGGMAQVFRARDRKLDRWVAIKIVEAFEEGSRAGLRFIREAQAAARFHHPNLVTVHDVGAVNDRAYLVMELVEGGSVRGRIRKGGPLPIADLLRIARQTAMALSLAHEVGIVHRDVKPDNVLLAPDGTAKLTDFGVVHISDNTITKEGLIVGTSRYMAPEQITGGKLDARTDLYALGATVYEMAVGAPPFADGDVAYRHLHEVPVPPRERRPDLPPALDHLILQLLSKTQDGRPRDAAEVVERIEAIEQMPAGPAPEQLIG